MTRRSPKGRTTPRGGSGAEPSAATGGRGPAGTDESSLASLRRRQPLAFWMAVIGAVAMIVATFGSLLSAFS
ncbi:MAG: hypothetical protein R2761_18290 [Acidimicrobiales bacterium]